MDKLPFDVEKGFRDLTEGARAQRKMSNALKTKALHILAKNLLLNQERILTANAQDLKNLAADAAPAFRDRLTLTAERLQGMAKSLEQVADLPDPVNEVVERKTLANGLLVRRVRSPLGVIFMIFESRPNVILEAFSLAFKSGNVIALRGGSESKFSNDILFKIMTETMKEAGVHAASFYGMQDYDRALVEHLLKRKDLIDIVVPRGGEKLIEFVQKTSLMPIIKNDRGLCHAYVAEDADLAMAVKIVTNGKTQRPGVCNSLETVLVNEKVAAKFIPQLYEATNFANLIWHTDAKSGEILKGKARVQAATEQDWNTEYLDQILNCRIVSDLEMAMEHISKYGSKHSETIITASSDHARRFEEDVDAAAVYWNASTRFTDGFELGLGGELGISTQKLHVRGPVGLRELTTPRWIIEGTGQIRE